MNDGPALHPLPLLLSPFPVLTITWSPSDQLNSGNYSFHCWVSFLPDSEEQVNSLTNSRHMTRNSLGECTRAEVRRKNRITPWDSKHQNIKPTLLGSSFSEYLEEIFLSSRFKALNIQVHGLGGSGCLTSSVYTFWPMTFTVHFIQILLLEIQSTFVPVLGDLGGSDNTFVKIISCNSLKGDNGDNTNVMSKIQISKKKLPFQIHF